MSRLPEDDFASDYTTYDDLDALERDAIEAEGYVNGAAAHVRVEPAPDLLPFNLTDLGNAERLVAFAGGRLRYVTEWDKWLAWTDRRWAADRGAPYRACKMMLRELTAQGNALRDPKRREAILGFAFKCESRKFVNAAVDLARYARPVLAKPTDFDADPMAFNVVNGTIDLTTGALRPHRREDLCTKLSPVAYDPAAKCQRFDAFLLEIMADNPELVAFVLAHLGYCLTGHTREHVLAFWHGPGGNGKGVLGGAVRHVMGTYAGKAAPDLLFRTEKTERHPTELADLHGKRLIVCNETQKGRPWDEALVKDLTGGDRLKARRMREDFWEWDPTHKLIVWGNHRPPIRNVDDGIRRRLRLVPFEVSFKGREDRTLVDSLKGESAGILARLVTAAVEWHRAGLPDATAVTSATDRYLADEDTLGQFFAE